MSQIQDQLKKEVWSQKNYYHQAHEASLDADHPGMKILTKLANSASKILDLGCGEGTRLNLVAQNASQGTGVDLSQTAISMARKKYPKFNFQQANLENLIFKRESFDLIYSAYVLEHLTDPEKVLTEAIRLLQKGGYLVLIAPNYGAPNRASPVFRGSRLKKLTQGLIKDFDFRTSSKLNWLKVKPIAKKNQYQVDWDTTVEPYLGSLIRYLKNHRLKIDPAFSCWFQELPAAKIHQRIFRLLGEKEIFPFWMWGPHLVVVSKK